MPPTRKVVWILGAGFSRGVGGPLLPNLLSEQSWGVARHVFPEAKFPAVDHLDCGQTILFYRKGLTQQLGPAQLWKDAEDFLEQVDGAIADGDGTPRHKRFCELLQSTWRPNEPPGAMLRRVGSAARQVIAAECASFTFGVNVSDSERWKPFRRWATKMLAPGDSVITFNYDLVLEKLAKLPGSRFSFPTGPDIQWLDGLEVPVFKLHGSLSWKASDRGGIANILDADECSFAKMPAGDLAIGTPGPSKAEMTKSLGAMWAEARRRIRAASAVVFVGYRFPETDSNSRELILEALAENTVDPAPRVHVVLGSGSPDVPRVTEMVTAALGRTRASADKFVVASNLLGQEFFQAYERDDLLPKIPIVM